MALNHPGRACLGCCPLFLPHFSHPFRSYQDLHGHCAKIQKNWKTSQHQSNGSLRVHRLYIESILYTLNFYPQTLEPSGARYLEDCAIRTQFVGLSSTASPHPNLGQLVGRPSRAIDQDERQQSVSPQDMRVHPKVASFLFAGPRLVPTLFSPSLLVGIGWKERSYEQ